MQDVVALWEQMLGDESPATVLVGHSMGGAIATRAAGTLVRLQPMITDYLTTSTENRPGTFDGTRHPTDCTQYQL